MEKDCFAEGRGKDKEAPEWWKKKVGKAKGASANVADTQEENYSLLAAIDSPNTSTPAKNSSSAEALAAMQTPVGSVIIDCEATNHFSPKRSKFLNYHVGNLQSALLGLVLIRHTFLMIRYTFVIFRFGKT